MWYIGVRYAKGCTPLDLWKKYFTSSKYVDEFRKINGEPDRIIIDNVYSDQKSATDREISLLKRFMSRKDLPLLNKSIAGSWDRSDIEISEKHRLSHVGHIHADEHKRKIGEANKGKVTKESTRIKMSLALKGKPKSEVHVKRLKEVLIGNSRRKGTKTSEEGRRNISNARIGMLHSKETKALMSVARKGKKQEIVICPHCEKSGGNATMHQWHFNNCKFKKE